MPIIPPSSSKLTQCKFCGQLLPNVSLGFHQAICSLNPLNSTFNPKPPLVGYSGNPRTAQASNMYYGAWRTNGPSDEEIKVSFKALEKELESLPLGSRSNFDDYESLL